jgi:hypothetical protein
MFDDENVKKVVLKKKSTHFLGTFVFHVRKKPNENTQDDTNARRTTHFSNTNSTLKRRERERERS